MLRRGLYRHGLYGLGVDALGRASVAWRAGVVRRVVASGALLALVAAGTAACTANRGGGADDTTRHPVTSAVDTNPAHSRGPARPVPGARRGGTLYALQEQDFEHLDPQNVYISDAESVAQLYARSLTTFAEGPDGRLALVGDLATGPGTDVDHDCRTWRYTLKSGLRYQDGSAITAADVGYGVARSFSPDIYHGPHYIQQWLAGGVNYNAAYTGPYNGAPKLPPGVTVKGTSQITFHFKTPACDMPFAAAWGTTSPVPASRDRSPTALDTMPFASGPYKVSRYVRGTELDLVRNRYWDPRTDPVRHDYVDKVVTYIGATAVQQAQRVLASRGHDANTVTRANVPAPIVPVVAHNAAARKRVVSGYLPFVQYLNINTERVTDVDVRRAINYAFDRRGFLRVAGGGFAGDPATTIESPLVVGYRRYDAYPEGKDGVDKAKELLHGRHPRLAYAYANTELNQKQAVVVRQSLQRAGFRVVLKPIDKSSYYHLIGVRHSGYDIYLGAWAADWPSGSTIIPQLFDGRSLATNPTWSWLDAKPVNQRIAQLLTLPADKAAPGWATLDKQIMTDYAPVVPVAYQRNYTLVGTNVGGVYLSAFVGAPSYTNAYLRK